ncbi:MAG TPA: SDR family oxidoreductase [Vicinamibacteria bacterium]|jgi:NAD(P)-dependent dehydrogenase (short-subunit alcohol dehydrogenase family)|nr:SDR family oxidoreductase [Vicinamibacteria bacterium]
MDLRGRSVLITGGSRGLGAALGRALARKGARVVLVARGRADLEGVVAEIRASGGEAHALVADVSQAEAIPPLVGAAAALVGPIDLLVHNASTLGRLPLRLLLETEAEELQRVLETNLVGPFRLTKAVAGSMLLRGRGLVLHISSDAAVVGYPRWGAYGISKAALDHLARIAAAELRGTGVRFLAVDPGEMNTRMHADAVPDEDPGSLRDPARVAERILALIEHAESLAEGARIEVMSWAPHPPLEAAGA